MAALVTTHDDPVEQEIANDAFWGGPLEFEDFQEEYRLPAEDAPTTYVRQVELALIQVNDELAGWRTDREAEGQEELTAEQVKLYRAAVYAWAYALAIPLMPALHSTDQADGIEDDFVDNEARFRSRAEGFIKQLIGRKEPGDFSMSVI